MRQFLQMKRERGRGDPKAPGDHARRETRVARLYQQAKEGEPRFLRKGGELDDAAGMVCRFHISNNMEPKCDCQRPRATPRSFVSRCCYVFGAALRPGASGGT